MTRVIERRLEFEAPVERVWKAISDPAELAQWFPDSADLDLRVGGAGAFSWDKHGRYSVRVELVEPPKRISWRWAKDPDVVVDDGPSTLVEWVLSERPGGGTILELRESGFVEDEHFKDNSGGWTAELAELQELLAR
jgi:uncharacterized protein YndB with AHSA1/START domain